MWSLTASMRRRKSIGSGSKGGEALHPIQTASAFCGSRSQTSDRPTPSRDTPMQLGIRYQNQHGFSVLELMPPAYWMTSIWGIRQTDINQLQYTASPRPQLGLA